jgi:alkanesulfonate monooxygenase SsuD/methylene tetrahydromethanopterin reductase-like flavin-dependent oxidoreductase (luciferase family)
MAELGKDPNPYQAGFIQFVGLADTDAEARELYRAPAEYFYHRCLHVYPGFADPPGYKSEGTVRAGVMSQIEAAAKLAEAAQQAGRAPSSMLTYEQMLDAGYIIVGSPTTVTERLHEVATTLNVGQLMVLLQFGDMGKDLARSNTELFARHVIPELHGLFDDRWEDRWWPRPLDAARRSGRDEAFVRTTEEVRR